MLVIARHGSDGFIDVAEPRRLRDHPDTEAVAEVYVILRDADSDGGFETATPLPAADLYSTYPPP
jgi:hypothetical protein